MAFTQTIEVRSSDERALHEHVSAWHAEQAGVAPGYQGARILADEKTPDRYVIEVDFSSRHDADRNNDRAETQAWAAKLAELADGALGFRDYRLVCTTDGER